jgi:hypothetical protein
MFVTQNELIPACLLALPTIKEPLADKLESGK